MLRKSTTIATLGRAVALTLEHYGCDSRQVFEQAGLDIELSYNPNARYDSGKMAELWRLAAHTCGDPAFGLEVPKRTSQVLNPAFDAAFVSSDNLLQALKRLCKMFHYVSEMGQLQLTHVGDSIFLEYRMSAENRSILANESLDMLFGALIYNIRQTIEPNFSTKGVYFSRPKPVDSEAYRELFRAPIYFDQTVDKLELDAEMLTKPLLGANTEVAKLNEQIILDHLKRAERDEVVLQVRFHIISRLPYGEPSQDSIASMMHMSTRQLRRKLQELDTNYSQVLLDTRHEIAKKYLCQDKLPLSEITQLVGFSDQSNFTKAFKRWQDETPLDYRKRHNPAS